MADDALQLGVVVGSAALVNTVYSIQKQRDAVPPLVASGILYGSLMLVGGLTKRFDLAVAFAWVFLLASLVTRGIPLVTTANTLATSGTKTPTNRQSNGGSGR
jgi:4-hydroxybenzoate polyprenyltransferase